MFQKDVSELINKVSNIAGMTQVRAPTPVTPCCHVWFWFMFFLRICEGSRNFIKKDFLIFCFQFLFAKFFIVKNCETIKT